MREISERKRAEEESRKLATIIKSVNDPIIAIDVDQRITVWNPAAAEKYGYTAEEALGEPLGLITPPNSDPIQVDNLAKALEGQQIDRFDTQKITKSGETLDVSLGGSPIFNQDNEVIGAVGIHRDMTEQRKVERSLRESEQRHNARLLDEKNRAEENQLRKIRQLQTVFKIAEALAGPADFQTKAENVSTVIKEQLEADGVVLRMLNKEAGTLDLVATSGTRFTELPNSLPLDEDGFSQRAFKKGESVVIVDYSKEPSAKPYPLSVGLQSICLISLRGADGPNGLLNIASRRPGHFNQEIMELLETMAGGIAALFESARLSENLEQTQKEIDVADQIARIITTTLDIGAAYDEFFAEVKNLVDFDFAGVVMVAENSQLFSPEYLTDPARVPLNVGQQYDLSGTMLKKVIDERSAVLVPNLGEVSDCWLGRHLVQVGLHSMVMTPLVFEDKIIGGFMFCSGDIDAFGDRERIILERLASQVVPSVCNAMLFQEADRYALALDSIGESFAFLDSDLRIQYVNRALENTYGYSAGELSGQQIWILADSDSADEAARKAQSLEIVEQSMKGGWSGEVVTNGKSGEKFDVLLTVSPVKDKTGHVIGLISVSRNITERKKTEARLTEQSRLASIGELAAGVAHEMNNPLTSILLCSQLLTESDLPEETLSDLAIISNAARRAAKIVQSLLLFARREDPKAEPMKLDLVVEQALELKKYDFRRNNIVTPLHFEADLPNSLIDRQQMSQVVLNILNNAEDALVAHQGGGRIRINVKSTSDAVILEFRDNGPGIASNLLHKIFEPFYTTKAPGEGTGLGLSICHGIVQQHGGEMWATSKKGSGMSFFVQLPITKAVDVSEPLPGETTESEIPSTGKILVVDDEPDIREIIAKGLANDFDVIDQAHSGKVAVDMIRASRYDCILLDLKMPGISGIEVFEKTLGYREDISERIIIMTGDTASPETASFLAGLSNLVIHMPFTLKDVRENISKMMERLEQPTPLAALR